MTIKLNSLSSSYSSIPLGNNNTRLVIPNAENICRRRAETANASTPYSATEEINVFELRHNEDAVSQTGNKKDAPPLLVAEAKRLYKNFVLTGVHELSLEEKKEIKNLIENYMKEHNFLEKYSLNQTSKEDYAAFNDFIKGMFTRFGKKDDYYEFVTDFVEGALEKVVNSNNPPKPPFKVEIPPEHDLLNTQKRPMLMPFQAPSPHKFLLTDDNMDFYQKR